MKLRHSPDTYVYDGSFAGLLCCIYESYACHEVPAGIESGLPSQLTFFSFREIRTQRILAEKVARHIRRAAGTEVLQLARHAYMSCRDGSALDVLLFVRFGLQKGSRVIRQLSHPYVEPIWKAERALFNEAHAFKGFARFSSHSGVLVSEIEPKCMVLPLLAEHFCIRFRNERFVIRDSVHWQALLYADGNASIIGAPTLQTPEADESEQEFQSLWKLYLETVPVEGRGNPRCQMSHMPRRFWKNMTEMTQTAHRILPDGDM